MALKWITRIVILLLLSMALRFLVISSVIEFKLSDKARAKIKEGQSFKDWFLYTRFRRCIPPIIMFWYFANFIFCAVTAVITIVWVLITGDNERITMVNDVFLIVSLIPFAVYGFMYRVICGRDMSYLFDRNKRYNRKKKRHPLQKKR